MNINEIKSRVLVTAGWIAPGEKMTEFQANLSLRDIVSDVLAVKTDHDGHIAAILIALELAQNLDNQP